MYSKKSENPCFNSHNKIYKAGDSECSCHIRKENANADTFKKTVSPGLTNLGRVESSQTEDITPNEGYIVFDIRFSVIYRQKRIKLLVNIEAQKSMQTDKLHYHLENRIIYYLSRLISSQKEVEFFHSDYDNIKKVYSIWICMDANDGEESVSKIMLSSETIFGPIYDFSELDKICGIVIRIRNDDNTNESKNNLIAMLEDVLAKENGEKKKEKLEKKYGMKMTVELARRIDDMCNLSELIIEEGLKQGIEQGIEQGRELGIECERVAVIERMLKKGKNPEEIVDLTGYKLEYIMRVQEKM